MSHPSPDPVEGESAAAGPTASLEAPALLVVSRFRVAGEAPREQFLNSAQAAIDALSGQPGCLAASLGQATDDPDLLMLRTEWAGVGAYRRALSAFDVKVNAIPLLSSAIDEPSAYEVVRWWDGSRTVTAASGLAADAGEVGLGRAAAASVAAVTT